MNKEIQIYLEPGKKNIYLIYISFLLSILVPAFAIVGGVFTYVNQDNEDDFCRSHYLFALKTFIMMLCSYILIKLLKAIAWLFSAGVALNMFINILQLIIFVVIVARCIIAAKYILEEVKHPKPSSWSV